MTTADDLFQAILADPADDDLRLVYADFLEDRDEPGDRERAEFIRVQCELARLPNWWGGYLGDAYTELEVEELRRFNTLRCRARELFCWDNINAWFGYSAWERTTTSEAEFDQLHREGVRALLVRRGFPARITCTGRDWWGDPGHPGHGPAIVRAAPLEQVNISDRQPRIYRRDIPEGHRWFAWHRGLDEPMPPDGVLGCGLPEWLWDLVVMQPGGAAHGPWADFDTPQAAHLAISTACLRWAWQPPCRECGGRGLTWTPPEALSAKIIYCGPCYGLGRDLAAPGEQPLPRNRTPPAASSRLKG